VLRKRVPGVGSSDWKSSAVDGIASLTGGTTRRLVPVERRALRPGTSTVEVSGPRYRGGSLMASVCQSVSQNWSTEV